MRQSKQTSMSRVEIIEATMTLYGFIYAHVDEQDRLFVKEPHYMYDRDGRIIGVSLHGRGKYLLRIDPDDERHQEALSEIIQLADRLNYRVKIIANACDLTLSTSQAAKTWKITTKEFFEKWCDTSFINLGWKPVGELLRKLPDIQNGKIKKIRIHRPAGLSYRLTYFDAKRERRVQVNMGNLCIVLSKNPIKLKRGVTRKRRSDAISSNREKCLWYDESSGDAILAADS